MHSQKSGVKQWQTTGNPSQPRPQLLSGSPRAPSAAEHSGPYQQQAGVHQAEGARPPDAGAAVHHDRAVRGAQRARLAHLEQEIQERRRRLRHPKVWPGGVVEVQNLSSFLALQEQGLGNLLVWVHRSEGLGTADLNSKDKVSPE